ncbi:MAG: hypothetical protein KAT11_04330 [Phycisphaerae bacterium]|nr:hypothetical protein [Phycisphaerae bacterium]
MPGSGRTSAPQQGQSTREQLAQALLKYETLDVTDVERIFKGESLEKPTVADLIEKESEKQA